MADPDLARFAAQTVDNRLSLTGQQVPAELVAAAARLLACVWSCGEVDGITAAEWLLLKPDMPQTCIDLAVIKRAGQDGGEGT